MQPAKHTELCPLFRRTGKEVGFRENFVEVFVEHIRFREDDAVVIQRRDGPLMNPFFVLLGSVASWRRQDLAFQILESERMQHLAAIVADRQ